MRRRACALDVGGGCGRWTAQPTRLGRGRSGTRARGALVEHGARRSMRARDAVLGPLAGGAIRPILRGAQRLYAARGRRHARWFFPDAWDRGHFRYGRCTPQRSRPAGDGRLTAGRGGPAPDATARGGQAASRTPPRGTGKSPAARPTGNDAAAGGPIGKGAAAGRPTDKGAATDGSIGKGAATSAGGRSNTPRIGRNARASHHHQSPRSAEGGWTFQQGAA